MIDLSEMYLFQRENGIWYAQLKRGRKRSLGTKDRGKAEARARILEKRIIAGNLKVIERKERFPLSDYLSLYKEWAKNNLAVSSQKRLLYILNKFENLIGSSANVLDFDYSTLDLYVKACRKLDNSPTCINTEIRHIKAAFGKWAHKRKHFRSLPFAGYEKLKCDDRIYEILSVEEVQRVFNVIPNKKYRLIFALYVYTGARREEIHRLEWRDVKEKHILVRKTKTSKPRVIPMLPQLHEILSSYPASVGRLFNVNLDQMGRMIKHYLRKAGLPNVRPHDLRHTFISHLLLAGVDPVRVSELAGHASPTITMKIYAHVVNRESLADAIKKLPY